MLLFSPRRTKVFISYSHKDTKHLDRLLVHLADFERQGIIDPWSDKKITPGANWRDEIRQAIESAKVAVLLVSADFLASQFIAEDELPLLLAIAETKGTAIIPVILSASNFEYTKLAQFQTVNDPSRPLIKLNSHQREELWVKIAKTIRGTIISQSPLSEETFGPSRNDQNPLDVHSASPVELDLPKPIAENIKCFTGRNWLLSHLLEWFQQSDERIFILTGEPGAGKSAVVAWLSGAGSLPQNDETGLKLDELRSRVKATHFCIAASGSVSPKNFIQNVVNQLMRNIRGFNDALVFTQIRQTGTHEESELIQRMGSADRISMGRIDLAALDDESSFNNFMRDPLKELYRRGFNEKIILLIDGLDEATTYTGSVNIVQLLTWFEDFPEQFRVLATSRPDPRVLKHYRKFRLFDLIENAPSNVDDVKLYAYERLSSLKEEPRLRLAERISNTAKGNFLYTYLVLNDLSDRPEILDAKEVLLPEKLGGLYYEFLNRELGLDEGRWYKTFKFLLGLIAIAQGDGLGKSQLEQIIGQEIEYALRTCAQYLNGNMPQGPFRLFHQSFSDFLLEDGKNIDYHIDAASMHRIVANFYLEKYMNRWVESDFYGLRYLAIHLLKAGYKQELCNLLTASRNWMDAKSARFGDDYDYGSDIELAINDFTDILIPSQLINLIKLYTTSLVIKFHRESVYNMARLEALVHLGNTEEALRQAMNIFNDDFRYLFGIYSFLKEMRAYDVSLIERLFDKIYSITDIIEKVNALTGLSYILFEEGRKDRAKSVIKEAWQLAYTIRSDRDKAECLCKIATVLSETDDGIAADNAFGEAKEATYAIQDETGCIYGLTSLARAYLQTGRDDKAEKVFNKAKELAHIHYRKAEIIRDLSEIAVALALSERGQEAENLLEEIQSIIISTNWDKEPMFDRDPSFPWRFLAEALAKIGHFDKSRQVIGRITDKEHMNHAIGVLITEQALKMIQINQIDEAIKIAETFPENQPYTKSELLYEIALAAARAKYIEKADLILKEADAISKKRRNEIHESWSWITKVRMLVRLGYIDEAVRFVSPSGVRFVARELIETGPPNSIERFIDNIERIVQEGQFLYERVETMCVIAQALALAGREAEAQVMFTNISLLINDIEDQRYLVMAYSKFGKSLFLSKQKESARNKFRQAKEITNAIPDNYEGSMARNSEWHYLSTALAEVGLVEEAIETIQMVKGDYDRVSIMAHVAQILMNANQKEKALLLFEEAKLTAASLGKRFYQAQELRTLAEELAKAGLLEEAEKIIQVIPDETLQKYAADDVIDVKSKNLAQQKRFVEAFNLLLTGRMGNVDDLITKLVDWIPIFEQVEQGLSAIIMREVARIAGWERPDWWDIYERLSR